MLSATPKQLNRSKTSHLCSDLAFSWLVVATILAPQCLNVALYCLVHHVRALYHYYFIFFESFSLNDKQIWSCSGLMFPKQYCFVNKRFFWVFFFKKICSLAFSTISKKHSNYFKIQHHKKLFQKYLYFIWKITHIYSILTLLRMWFNLFNISHAVGWDCTEALTPGRTFGRTMLWLAKVTVMDYRARKCNLLDNNALQLFLSATVNLRRSTYILQILARQFLQTSK